MKKILSVFMALLVAFLLSATAFAKSESKSVPIINVTGFARTNLVMDKGEETEERVFSPSNDSITALLKNAAPDILAFLLLGNNRRAAKALVPDLNELFEPLRFDDSGKPVYNNISLEKESGGSNGNYTFRYDWRYDVMDIANNLNEFIHYVKNKESAEKVALVSESMGGAVTMAYLYLYGYNDVSAVVMCSSALFGITVMGDIFTKNLSINSKYLMGYLKGFIQGDSADKVLIRGMITTFGTVLANPLTKRLNGFIEDEKDYIYEESLCDLFGNIPGLWSFIPDEYYENAKKTMLDETQNAELIKTIDVYHYNVRPNTEKILKEIKSNGVTVAFISNYGLYSFPVSENGDYMSDFLIDTKFTSGGAVCSGVDSTLGENYVQANPDGHNHLSCDGQIDASTCMFPENTWFVKGMIHTWYNSDYHELVNWIIAAGESADVYSNKKFPQFLSDCNDDGTLEILSKENSNPLCDKITVHTIAEFIKSLFN